MSTRLRSRLPALAPLLLAGLATAAVPVSPPARSPAYRAFTKQNDTAMSRMMADMAVKPTGDVDLDFVAMMIPHHQGAIDMARAMLRYGRNAQLKLLAQHIVTQQTKEIAFMRAAVPGPIPIAAGRPGHAMTMR